MERSGKGYLSEKMIKKFKATFEADQKNILAMNACTKSDPLELCLKRSVTESTHHVFTHKVDSEAKPVTNQKNSGRCWIFAALNVLRIPFIKEHQLEDFEFSQNFIFFWDKVERCNYFLHLIVDLLLKNEPIEGRLISFLLQDPIPDGGQWDMLVNIISRYGVVPKKYFPDTYCSETSCKLNAILKSKIREYVSDLKLMIDTGCRSEELEENIQLQMEELYRIIGICLGIPPETFTWEYYNKNKAYCCIGPITPIEFYQDHVKPYCNIEEKVCLVNDPRSENPYGKSYTVDCLGNMVGGRKTIYINETVEKLLKFAAESIKNNEAVWFGCEVGKRFYGKAGVQDINLHDFKLLFGTNVNCGLSKAQRLVYGDSAMDHAMIFTGVSLDENGESTKWRVENSWGDEKGEKGYLVMTTEWFKEFGFEVVIHKRHVPQEILEALKMEPKVLPAWDPMGALA